MSRLRFALTYRTLGKLIVSPTDPAVVLVYHRGRVVEQRRRCPHQGAPMEQGYINGDDLVCPWHGCRFALNDDCDHAPKSEGPAGSPPAKS